MNPKISIAPKSSNLAHDGAAIVANILCKAIEPDGKAAILFAAAISQDPFLAALRTRTDVPWPHVTAFHMDEYCGMTASHPASFRRFLRGRITDHLPLSAFHQIAGENPDPDEECRRYTALLNAANPGLAILGIGENGHLAFIDPPVCDFNDPREMRCVELDDICRMQQVHDGAFATLDEVPRKALSLTVPRLMRIPKLLVFVNGERKAKAVQAALEGSVTEQCPASALQRHPDVTIFLDEPAAGLLERR